MKFFIRLSLMAMMILFSFVLVQAQDDEKLKEQVDEIKGKVDGIDENVNTLLTDVAGLKKLKVSGYLQIQYMHTEKESGFGTLPYSVDLASKDQFIVRRGRLKFNYASGLTQFVIQGDFSNKGFTLKDAYLDFTDPWTEYFTIRTGVFNRPNFEVEYSSSQRESMERSTIIRTLYPDERDLGAMLTVNPDDLFKLQIAGFNNTYQGGFKQFYPNYRKEPLYFMARLTKELLFQDAGMALDLGVHARFGNAVANSDTVILSENKTSVKTTDQYKKGETIGRNWYGFEAQFYWDFLGGMKLMGEYIMGSNIDEPKSNAIRMREFSGFYAMLVKNIGSQWQLALKYDSYDPNTKIADNDIDVKEDLVTNTIGFGLHNYSFSNIRVSLWYDMINTQTTSNTKFASDPIDNQLTLRLQYKF